MSLHYPGRSWVTGILGNWKLGWSRQYCAHILSSFSQTFAVTSFFQEEKVGKIELVNQLFVSELEEGHANQSNHANQLFVSELEEGHVFA